MSALTAEGIAPVFSLKDTKDQPLSLAEALKKGPVLAAFFKVCCPVCQFTFPFLERLHQAYGGSKFTLWGISQDDARDSLEFAEEFGVTFPILIDDGFSASNQYHLTNVPSLFWISPAGVIKESSVGFTKAGLERMAAEAASASEHPPAPLFRRGEVIPEYKPG